MVEATSRNAPARANQHRLGRFSGTLVAAAALLLPLAGTSGEASAGSKGLPPATVIVHSALGGTIIGYDIDQNGTEGVLSEYVVEGNGFEVAIETFDQTTGKIKKIIRKTRTHGGFVTLGIVGTSIGLVERQTADPYVDKTIYDLLDPVAANQITGHWTPNLRKIDNHIQQISENQGSATTAFLGTNFHTFQSFVFGADVTANTSGPITLLTDYVFSEYPVMALDTATNQAVVAAANSGFYVTPELAIVDLVKGGFKEFAGLGNGQVNGIAVDSADGIACTTTQNDWSVEFYNIATQGGSIETLKGATSNLNSGYDVQFDPVNKLFLIDQQVCSGSESSGCIQVYDTSGNWVETETAPGFSHIAFNPNTRHGFLWLNDGAKFDELQSFTY